jgi:hypothetical protein
MAGQAAPIPMAEKPVAYPGETTVNFSDSMVLQRLLGNHVYPPLKYNDENRLPNTVCRIPVGEIDPQSALSYRKNSSMDGKTEALHKDYH